MRDEGRVLPRTRPSAQAPNDTTPVISSGGVVAYFEPPALLEKLGIRTALAADPTQMTAPKMCTARAMAVMSEFEKRMANGHAEWLIDPVRRECLDRMLVFGEAHLTDPRELVLAPER